MSAALAYKAWRDSRTRFLLGAATLAWFCAAAVVFRPAAGASFSTVVDRTVYTGSIRNFFVIFVVVLGLGGLRLEAAHRSVWFTLSLPATRLRHAVVRALVGIAEVTGLAFVPSVDVLGLAPFLHERYAAATAMHYSLQWAVAGSMLFALAYLMSVVVAGTYAPLVASWIVLGVYALVMFASPAGRVTPLNAFALMGVEHQALQTLVVSALLPASTIGLSAWLTERRDF